jgi:hypothetical protein
LINEYINPCPAIRNKQKTYLEPLTEFENITLEGQILEAEVKLKEFLLNDKANPITTHSRYPSPINGFRTSSFEGYYVSLFKLSKEMTIY